MPDNDDLLQRAADDKAYCHRKGKMTAFDEETFIGTWECLLCGQLFSRKASIVCTSDMTEDK